MHKRARAHVGKASFGRVVLVKSLEDWNSQIGKAQAANKLAVVQFTAVWCPPCKAITPAINQLSRRESDVVFLRLDVDRVPDVAKYLSVRQLPTFMYFIDGAKVGEYTGTAVAEVIKQLKQHKAEASKQAGASGGPGASGGSVAGLLVKGLLLAGVGSFAFLASQGKLPPAVTEALEALKDSLFGAPAPKAVTATSGEQESSGQDDYEKPPWEEGDDDGLTLTLTQVSWNDGEGGATNDTQAAGAAPTQAAATAPS